MSFKRLFSFPGGLQLNKSVLSLDEQSIKQQSVSAIKIPDLLTFPLQLPNGSTASAIVEVGDTVSKGQLIAVENDSHSIPIHASSSGTIIAIETSHTSHPSGIQSTSIKLKTDGEDKWIATHSSNKINHSQWPAEKLRSCIQAAGIAGMGGAGFPSATKLKPDKKHPIDTLILNGVECEPIVCCDNVLMQIKAHEIIAGAKIMMRALQTHHCIIAIEDNKEEAIQSLTTELKVLEKEGTIIEIIRVPDRYPAGGEKQLIKLLTNKNIAKNSLPCEHGLVCHNVATAAAVYRAISFNEPLISRIVTLSSTSTDTNTDTNTDTTVTTVTTKNLDVLIGTSVETLIKLSGLKPESINKVIMGGPMMGTALHCYNIPIDKTTLAILLQSKTIQPNPVRNKQHQAIAMPCIRCGSCAEVCPIKLLPQQLFWHAQAKEIEKTNEFHMMDCIECGCCDYVCPSHIPLIQYFRFAKAEIRALEENKVQSNAARQRYEFRLQRLERNKRERAERHRKKIDELALKNNKDEGKSPSISL